MRKPRSFETTRWSVVLAAGQQPTDEARDALAVLCEAYWYPLYAYIRHRGHPVEEAQDLTQEFFERFLEKSYLKDVRPERGRFRSFLLASLNHFLANEWDKQQAQKRGGGATHVSLDIESGESRFRSESSRYLSPEKLFDRGWALTLLERVLARLAEEHVQARKAQQFECLKDVLTGRDEGIPYKQLAQGLALTEGAVKVAVHRMRRRYRDLLLQEIRQTVADEHGVAEELKYLMAAVAS